MAAKPNITWTELRDALKWVDGSMTLIFAHSATDTTYQRTHFGNSDKLRRSISAGP
ncbi:hypothetical protein J3R82DRAFT_7022 [Butyriboletus roseoflavus]|nr:hypothetical protein J3R82DRAFT_7022 [Butyriboletus roseoflavus]